MSGGQLNAEPSQDRNLELTGKSSTFLKKKNAKKKQEEINMGINSPKTVSKNNMNPILISSDEKRQAAMDGSDSEAFQFRVDDVKSPQSISGKGFGFGNESKVEHADGS